MVGRQTPLLAVVVPLVLVAVIDGRRGVRQTWPAALVAGVVFAAGQFVASNYISVPLTDIIASLLAAAALVLLMGVRHPVESPDLRAPVAERATASPRAGEDRAVASSRAGGEPAPASRRAGDAPATAGNDPPRPGSAGGDDLGRRDSGAEIARAYAPYLIIIVIFSIANIGAVKAALAGRGRSPSAGPDCTSSARTANRSPPPPSPSAGSAPPAP